MKRTLIVFATLATLVAIVHLLVEKQFVVLDPTVLMILRWICIGVLIFFGFQRKSLTGWILIMLVAGFEFGYDAPGIAARLEILSDIFLRLIKTIIAPLLFGTLVAGIAGHASLRQVGRMGIKALVYFEVMTTFALIIGLVAINISKAGEGVPIPADSRPQALPQPQSVSDIILHIFPENIAKAVAEGQILQVVIFSILFGIGLSLVGERRKKPVLEFCEGLGEVMFKFTNIVMYLAPFAVFGAVGSVVAAYGLGVFSNLFQLLLTLYVALIAFVVLILIPVMLIAKIPVRKFFIAVAEPFTLAFATASSESALPIAMEKMEEFGVPRKIVAFVLPTGYSFNLDGSTLYLALAAVFVAQAGNVDLPVSQQIIILLTLMITSKGVAGVPRAALVILAATVSSFGLPSAPIMLILGIDALMDMGRTSVNVFGNCLASAVVAKWEGELRAEKKEVGI